MNVMNYSQEQLELLNKASSIIDDLFILLNLFKSCRQGSLAATKFEEGFSWFEKLVAQGELIQSEKVYVKPAIVEEDTNSATNPIDSEIITAVA